jgi:hypothetical protein
LLAGTHEDIGKRPRERIAGTSVAPEFIPKRDSELIGNRGRIVDDAARPEIGEEHGMTSSRLETCFRFGTGLVRKTVRYSRSCERSRINLGLRSRAHGGCGERLG